MNITRGKLTGGAKKVLLYGPEGIGKSTFASMFPEPVFIDTEGGTKELDVARFDAPSSWAMLRSQIQYVIDNPGVCKTLVLDTADWAEKMCIEHICAEKHFKSIEDAGYGKGYVYVKETFGSLLNLLTDAIEKGVNVLILAHAQMRKFEQPDEMGSYDRWELKLSKQDAPLVKEWSDMTLFANYKTHVVEVKGKNKAQGGARVMYTTHHNCWDAKNRYGLPEELPFDYNEIRHVIESAKTKTKTNTPRAVEEKRDSQPDQMTLEDALTDAGEDNEKSAGKKQAEPETDKADYWKKMDKKIPKKLRDLMIADKIHEVDLQNVVDRRQPGVFPIDMQVSDYPQDFIDGWILPNWDKIVTMSAEIQAEYDAEAEDLPFA